MDVNSFLGIPSLQGASLTYFFETVRGGNPPSKITIGFFDILAPSTNFHIRHCEQLPCPKVWRG